MPPVASTGGNSATAKEGFRRQLRDATAAITDYDFYRDFGMSLPVPLMIARRKALEALRNLQTEIKNAHAYER